MGLDKTDSNIVTGKKKKSQELLSVTNLWDNFSSGVQTIKNIKIPFFFST